MSERLIDTPKIGTLIKAGRKQRNESQLHIALGDQAPQEYLLRASASGIPEGNDRRTLCSQ